MGKAKDAAAAAKEYAKNAQRDWRETAPQSSKDIRKLEGTDKRNRKK
ncbi:hypothetical protein H0B56_03855 [Haloechinothrix sp. YIM 98757]|uniref:Uncharacterized protein n=1 Tax=Haloechinothrix aidingensis TaxID=2752311 RepID=A0A838A4U0_9PSEU|nr:hypothetical protein [Haloechinothrix aidingensis]MBA0124670.1 hypothetical protein [Haloechinothrix aidingensis]